MDTQERLKVLVIAGSFDDKSGRPSGYARKLFLAHPKTLAGRPVDLHLSNGGTLEHLNSRFGSAEEYDVIYWFADLSNDLPKILHRLKVKAPKALLISSKNNAANEYVPLQLIDRALKSKSNLLVEFTRFDSQWAATVWDPLGNAFAYRETDIVKVQEVLFSRVNDLLGVTRIGSESVGPAIPAPIEADFFTYVRANADKLHDLVHAVNQERFVGNVSFRCVNGFPSYRSPDGRPIVFVSRRNIDKREIFADGFVAVEIPDRDFVPGDKVRYYGDVKPSVDTPIQIQIYRKRPWIRYMLHSHAYISGGLMTSRVLPCGSLEEIDEVLGVTPVDAWASWSVNLLGHGSLRMANGLAHRHPVTNEVVNAAHTFKNIPYHSRDFPEIYGGWDPFKEETA